MHKPWNWRISGECKFFFLLCATNIKIWGCSFYHHFLLWQSGVLVQLAQYDSGVPLSPQFLAFERFSSGSGGPRPTETGGAHRSSHLSFTHKITFVRSTQITITCEWVLLVPSDHLLSRRMAAQFQMAVTENCSHVVTFWGGRYFCKQNTVKVPIVHSRKIPLQPLQKRHCDAN